MSISALEKIHISDDDIDQIEILMGNVSFDAPRRDIIKKLDSFDVQAFPGSGKTTVLIAKLAILAKNGHMNIKVSASFPIQMWREKK